MPPTKNILQKRGTASGGTDRFSLSVLIPVTRM